VSLIRYPMKINSRGDLGLTLHDLSWDPWERSDLMATQPEVAARLGAELEAFVTSRVQHREPASAPELSEDAARALKSLGYVE